MINRAKRYGIFKELKRVADYLGLEAVEMPNPGTKFFPKELIEALGVGRKAPVKVGDRVPAWHNAIERAKVKAIYKDILGNEQWLTDFTHEIHIRETLKQKRISSDLGRVSEIKKFLNKPDKIYQDVKENALLYVRIVNGQWFALVVGKDSRKIFTIMRIKPTLNSERYRFLWERKK